MMRCHLSKSLVSTLVALVLLGFVVGAASGQWSYASNETDGVIYLRVENSLEYRHAPAGGLIPLEPGTRYEGFVYDPGSFVLPTLSLSSQIRSNSVITVSESDLSFVSVDSSSVADALSGPRVDGQYLEWVPVDAVLARARGRLPVGAFVSTGEGRRRIDPEDALIWERAGTDLEWLKTARVGGDVFFAVSAYSEFSRTSAVSFYVYGSESFPALTFSVDVGDREGYVFLWIPTSVGPKVIGNFVASDFVAEGQIWLDVLADTIRETLPGSDYTVEIATTTTSSGAWEEFVLARVSVEELVAR